MPKNGYAKVMLKNEIVRVVRDGTKIYSEEWRARKYGGCQDPAPIYIGRDFFWLPFNFARNGKPIRYMTETQFICEMMEG